MLAGRIKDFLVHGVAQIIGSAHTDIKNLAAQANVKLIDGQKVFAAGRMVTSRSKEIPENVPVSVRGFGRFRLLSVEKTKKERLKCRVEK